MMDRSETEADFLFFEADLTEAEGFLKDTWKELFLWFECGR